MNTYQSTDPIAHPVKVIDIPSIQSSTCSSSSCGGHNSGASNLPLRKVDRRSFRRSNSLSHSYTLRQNLGPTPTKVTCIRNESAINNQLSPKPPRPKKGMPPRCKSDGSGTAKTVLSMSTKSAPVRRNKPTLAGESAAMSKPTPSSRKGKKSLRSASMSKISFPENDFGKRGTRTMDLSCPFDDETLQVNTGDTWNCTCGHRVEGIMKFCGLCGSKKYWTCAGCAFDENKCMYLFCGMRGDSR